MGIAVGQYVKYGNFVGVGPRALEMKENRSLLAAHKLSHYNFASLGFIARTRRIDRPNTKDLENIREGCNESFNKLNKDTQSPDIE